MYLIKYMSFVSKKNYKKPFDTNWYDILVIKSPQYGLDFVASCRKVTGGGPRHQNEVIILSYRI